MEEIKLPKRIEVTKTEGNKATLLIEPCFPGYGLTLANALRRVLLSSLSGGAVTSIKIKGVDHEFSTIPYIREDVVEIILNLKQLRMKVHREEPVKLILKVKGEKEIKGSDVKTTSDVEITSPDLHIASLTDKKAELDMEIKVASGRGYNSVEQREGEKREVGEIAIDSFFTPVRKVSYNIENMRVGEMTNFDRLEMKIETDGTVSPKEALEEAAKILTDHFSLLGGIKVTSGKSRKSLKRKKKVLKKKTKESNESLIKKAESLSLEDLKFSTRTINALKKKKILKVRDLTKMTEKKLSSLSGIGAAAVKEIRRVLGRKGILLKQE